MSILGGPFDLEFHAENHVAVAHIYRVVLRVRSISPVDPTFQASSAAGALMYSFPYLQAVTLETYEELSYCPFTRSFRDPPGGKITVLNYYTPEDLRKLLEEDTVTRVASFRASPFWVLSRYEAARVELCVLTQCCTTTQPYVHSLCSWKTRPVRFGKCT